MSITFGGLATGLDTDSIISALMDIERTPINRLETDKSFYKSRLDAFSQLDGKLKTFLAKAEAIDTPTELKSPGVTSSSKEYLSVTAESRAQLGSYQISVVALAQQQKDVSQGYADKGANDFGTGTLSLTVGGVANTITIDASNNSLEGIAAAINDADLGVSAAIINDGTELQPYRLVLTGESVSDTLSLDSSGLSGGTEVNPVMSTTQSAQQAHVRIDGIDVYGESNSLDSSIPGLTLELLKADETVSTTINIAADNDATTKKIKGFVDAYNGVINFIASQKDADWGNDSAFRSVKRRMQDLIVSQQGGGTYSALSQLGFETQKDGTIVLNNTMLSSALEADYDGVVSLFAGDGETEGISAQFSTYLGQLTDSEDGLYAGRKKTTESNIKRADQRITSLEARLELKEKTLRAKYAALEDLVSGLNAQGGYLLQQLATMPTIGNSSN